MAFYEKRQHPKLEDQLALFSKKPFTTNQVVFDTSDLPIIDANHRYAITLNHDRSEYIETKDSDVKYLNHSCNPSLSFEPESRCFVACKNIEIGEMFTFDYTTTEVVITSPFQCLCGNTNCKKMIGTVSLSEPIATKNIVITVNKSKSYTDLFYQFTNYINPKNLYKQMISVSSK